MVLKEVPADKYVFDDVFGTPLSPTNHQGGDDACPSSVIRGAGLGGKGVVGHLHTFGGSNPGLFVVRLGQDREKTLPIVSLCCNFSSRTAGFGIFASLVVFYSRSRCLSL